MTDNQLVEVLYREGDKISPKDLKGLIFTELRQLAKDHVWDYPDVECIRTRGIERKTTEDNANYREGNFSFNRQGALIVAGALGTRYYDRIKAYYLPSTKAI